MNAGQKLRAARETTGLTIRDVETASARLAAKYGVEEYNIRKGIILSIYRLYALSVIYRVSIEELFSWYGVLQKQRGRIVVLQSKNCPIGSSYLGGKDSMLSPHVAVDAPHKQI